MEPKEVDIEFPRGDTFTYGFELVDAKKNPLNLTSKEAEIYFTCKKNENTSEVIFQKKFSTGEIQFVRDGIYCLTINSKDTNELKYGNYGYDVTIKSGDFVATRIIGQITLTKEFTFKSNE